MSDLRALLLTDVVDSTKLSLRVGDAEMARLWTAHDRAARDLLPGWHGREIDKTDGMLLMFDAASDAVGYALAYQQALNQLVPPLKARVGLHVGPVTLRENSPADVALGAKPIEVEGVAKATAARVMSVAMGGQNLLSADARKSLSAAGFRLQSHGHWRLKGLDEPIELFEAGDDRSPFFPPPDSEKAYRVVRQGELWFPVREIRHSVPSESDAFVGRIDELAELSRQFQADVRLVSVLGVGGTGKTRLVMRYGRSWLGEFPGGVWFCDLAPARSIDGIASAVAQGLDISLGRDDPVAQIGHAIAGRGRCMVILDNFEQVARFARQTVGQWLACADQALFVATTREILGLAGEVVFALPPLPTSDGAVLFTLRAQASKPDFQPNAEDLAATGTLVALLDGLPLAIELAAARVRVMPPRMLLARMSERFKLLASKGGRLDRQSTLRTAFDWSWDLLSMPEKATLAQLSVFESGFTLEAAEAVIDLSAWADAPWTVDAVQALVDKSFVRSRGDVRFDLLVSVQAYAAEHLRSEGRYAGSGPQALVAAQARHIAWFAAITPVRAGEGRGADLDNLVTACRRAVANGDSESAVRALEGASQALFLRGPFQAGVELADAVCTMPGLNERTAAAARFSLANMLAESGRLDPAKVLYKKAQAHARAEGNECFEAWVSFRLGKVHANEGQAEEARTQYITALQMAHELGDRRLECWVTNGLGALELLEGNVSEASLHYERALSQAGDIADRHMQGVLLASLGDVHRHVGHMDQAQARYSGALAIARDMGIRPLEGNILGTLGRMYLVQERLAESEASFRAALLIARELGNELLEASAQCGLGYLLEGQGRADEAQAQIEAAVKVMRSFGDSVAEGRALAGLGMLQARGGCHDAARHSLDLSEALLRSASDKFGVGMLLISRAEADHLAGDAHRAKASFAAGEAFAVELGADPASRIWIALARVRTLIEPGRS